MTYKDLSLQPTCRQTGSGNSSFSTILREMRRNSSVLSGYSPHEAQSRYKEPRNECRPKPHLADPVPTPGRSCSTPKRVLPNNAVAPNKKDLTLVVRKRKRIYCLHRLRKHFSINQDTREIVEEQCRR
jgi:hypothetical protein